MRERADGSQHQNRFRSSRPRPVVLSRTSVFASRSTRFQGEHSTVARMRESRSHDMTRLPGTPSDGKRDCRTPCPLRGRESPSASDKASVIRRHPGLVRNWTRKSPKCSTRSFPPGLAGFACWSPLGCLAYQFHNLEWQRKFVFPSGGMMVPSSAEGRLPLRPIVLTPFATGFMMIRSSYDYRYPPLRV